MQRAARSFKKSAGQVKKVAAAVALAADLQNRHSRPHHVVVHVDVALRRAQVLVPRQRHNHLRAYAAVRQLGNKPASARVTARAAYARQLVNLPHKLRQRVRQKVPVLLRCQQRRIKPLRSTRQRVQMPLQFLAQLFVHVDRPRFARLRRRAPQHYPVLHRAVALHHIADLQRRNFADPHS
jgi:hypothetical protein